MELHSTLLLPTTQNIFNTLRQPTMVENFSQLKNNKPTHIYQETTLREAFDDFVRVSELIISIIENELFVNSGQ